jgi:hypothetical protein
MARRMATSEHGTAGLNYPTGLDEQRAGAARWKVATSAADVTLVGQMSSVLIQGNESPSLFSRQCLRGLAAAQQTDNFLR